MAKTTYEDAPEVRDIAEQLIEKHHRHLLDLKVPIEYIFISKTPKKGGKEVWGTCRKISGLAAFLTGRQSFFVITISLPVWEVLPLDKKVALTDHELCHAWAEPNEDQDDEDNPEPYILSIIPHDAEEFCAIIKRHGLWYDGIKDIVEAAAKKKNESKNEDPPPRTLATHARTGMVWDGEKVHPGNN